MVAQEAFLLMRARLGFARTLNLCAHQAGRLVGTVERNLFKRFLLLARQKALKETGTSLSKSLCTGSKESLTDLSYTTALGRSDRFQLFLQV
jgi:hypothetical protein